MKIGIIGLGNIAQKAYLPVISGMNDVELVLCTRNPETLNRVSAMYRIPQCVQTVDELIERGINAAFVHSATEAHAEITEKLLNNDIDVYVDKPIAYSYDDALKLVQLSEEKNRILMVGFNRRFAPMYKKLKEQSEPGIVLVQKNRVKNPDNVRRFIFDDFIHVIDTLRYFAPGNIENIQIQSLQKDDKLHNVVLQLCGKNYTAIGIMNRDNGITEEVVELMAPNNKWVVKNLTETIHFKNGEEKTIRFNDWDPVLYRRGFQQIIEHFIQSIKNNTTPSPSIRDSLITHEICEKIVNDLELKHT